jgi:hypothetical protein
MRRRAASTALASTRPPSSPSTVSYWTRLTKPISLAVWPDTAAFMKRQPGCISTQLHRALGDSPAYLNHAVRESTEAFRAALTHPAFVAKLSAYPSPAVASPHLFQKIAGPRICTA